MSSEVVCKKPQRAAKGKGSGGIFAIFKNRNYALYFGGQFVSLISFDWTFVRHELLACHAGARCNRLLHDAADGIYKHDLANYR